MTDSEFVAHEPCDNCGSSDANAVYSDGHKFCFRCLTRTPAEGVNHTHKMSKTIHLQGSAERLQKRKISEKVCQFYQIYKHDNTLRFPYFTEDGVLQGVKVKTKQKDFYYEGVSTNTLFGQHRFPSSGRRIVVTEGELDAASCYEAMPGWPMVSLPHGATSAKKDIQKQIPLFQGYEEIILFFDSDTAGRQATDEACSVLPPGKVKVARLESYKDASEACQANDFESVRRAIWDAKPYRPDGIIDGNALYKLVTTPEKPCAYEYHFKGIQEKLHGIRYGELTTITAGSGTGKTSFCRELAARLCDQGESVGILELEASNRRTALGLMSVVAQKPLHIGEHSEEELRAAFERSIANWSLYCFDGFGSFDPDLVYNRIEYMATGLDCKVVFLDHLSILLSGLDGDERRMIDTTMTKLRSLVERTGIALFLVSHLRRTNSDTNHEEGARVTLGQLRGSAAIAQLSDQVIALERNQQANAERSFTTVRILKNRYSGETGVACQLEYDLSTCRFIEHEAENTPTKSFDPASDF